MKYKIASKGTLVDNDLCVENVGKNRFDLVLIAAARAREISRQHKNSESKEHINSPVQALLEIQVGKIGREYLKRVR